MLLRQIIYIFVSFVNTLLFIVQMLMFARAVLSWIAMDDDGPVLGPIMNFLYAVTEPLIYPVRMLLEKIPALRTMPIDLSFMVTFMLLSAVQMMLPVITL